MSLANKWAHVRHMQKMLPYGEVFLTSGDSVFILLLCLYGSNKY